jgi:hypothetical protein
VDRVLAIVHDKGRFLEPSGDDTLWIELTDKKVREKISQVCCLTVTAINCHISVRNSLSCTV